MILRRTDRLSAIVDKVDVLGERVVGCIRYNDRCSGGVEAVVDKW